MGNTWITAAEDHIATPEQREKLSVAWRRHADLTGRLVVAAATVSEGFLFKSSIPCIRRPKKKPCPGVIHFRVFDEPEEITWFCIKCDDNGTIHGWRKTIDHFKTAHSNAKIHLEPLGELFVTDAEFQFLVKSYPPIENVQRYRLEKGHMVLGTIEEMEPLLGAVAHARSETADPEEKKTLLVLFERIEEDIGISKDLAEELGNNTRPN